MERREQRECCYICGVPLFTGGRGVVIIEDKGIAAHKSCMTRIMITQMKYSQED